MKRTKLHLFRCEKQVFESYENQIPPHMTDLIKGKKLCWLDVDGVHDHTFLHKLCGIIGLHPLTVEDIVNIHQRPKFEEYHDYIYITLKYAHISQEKQELEYEQISLVIFRNSIITFQEDVASDVFAEAREKVKNFAMDCSFHPETEGFRIILKKALKMFIPQLESIADSDARQTELPANQFTLHLTYLILDSLVDQYSALIGCLEERVDAFETLIFSNARVDLAKLHLLRQDIVKVKRALIPLSDIFSSFTRKHQAGIPDAMSYYWNDIKDHIIRNIESLNEFQEEIGNLYEMYLNQNSYRLNEVMKVLTIISSLFIPVTFIAGVYGMNFRNIPELRMHYGYYFTLLLMGLIWLLMLVFFWKKKWF